MITFILIATATLMTARFVSFTESKLVAAHPATEQTAIVHVSAPIQETIEDTELVELTETVIDAPVESLEESIAWIISINPDLFVETIATTYRPKAIEVAAVTIVELEETKKLTVRAMKQLAKERGFKGYSSMNKAQLEELLGV